MFFPNKRQKKSGCGWEKWAELGRVEEGKTIIRIYCIGKESIFNKMGKKAKFKWG